MEADSEMAGSGLERGGQPSLRAVGRQWWDWTVDLWWRGLRRSGVAMGRREDPWGRGVFGGRLRFLE